MFSGIGGFSLSASWVWDEDHNIVAFVEQDKFCQKVLRKHWPDVPIVDNIEDYKHEQTETIDLLTGGFPCQPFSVAGKQRGKEDDRFLWHQMLRIIKESRPPWIIGENVTGIINMELDNCITDLEGEGYETQTFNIGAIGVNARHRRQRIWIVANRISMGWEEGPEQRIQSKEQESERQESEYICKDISEGPDVADTNTKGLQGSKKTGDIISNRQESRNKQSGGCDQRGGTNRPIKSQLGNLADGLSRFMVEPDIPRVATGIKDRTNKLKALGNAIVPQTVVPIMQAIKNLLTNPINYV